MSESESIERILPARKRLRNPSEWKREKRKRLRVEGKAYINTKGNLVEAKAMGHDCKCRRKCYLNVPEEIRRQLFHGYYSLKNHDEQNAYLFSLIRRQNVARKRSKNSDRRSCTYKYFLRLRSGELQVCRLAFANIHGISPHKIRILCQKLEKNVMFPSDERGKHENRPKKISSVVLNSIKEHIHSIISSDKVHNFLKEIRNTGAELNVTKMWKDYLKNYDPCFNPSNVSVSSSWNGLEDMLNCKEDNGIPPQKQNCAVIAKDTKQLDNRVGAEDEKNIRDSSITNNSNDSSQSLANTEEKTGSCRKDISNATPIVKHWLYNRVFHEVFSFHDCSLLKKRLHEKLSTSPQSSVQQKSVRKQRLPKKILQEEEEAGNKEPCDPFQEVFSTLATQQSHELSPDEICHPPQGDQSEIPGTDADVHGILNTSETATHALSNFTVPLPEHHGTSCHQKLLQEPLNSSTTPLVIPQGGMIYANYQINQSPASLMFANIAQQGTNIPSQYFYAGDSFYE